MAIKQALTEIPEVEIVGALSNGQLAVDFLEKGAAVDLITLDMEMPILDGMETIKKVRKFNKRVAIIVFSSHTTKGAEKTIDALSLGANDFVTKEESGGAKSIDNSLAMIRENLFPKIVAFQKMVSLREEPAPREKSERARVEIDFPIKPKLIVMTSSTGGPEALTKVFKNLKKGSNIPILLVQHMPPIFTAKLADMLSKISPGYTVLEAKGGEVPQPDHCYVAPGDYHMVLDSSGKLQLNQGEKVCFVRPAANCLFESVAQNFKQKVASFVLTGMGEDGAEGVEALSKQESYNFYQDQDSCTVWGMPAAVERSGLGKCLELSHIPEVINYINSRI
jgi:two-component system chemotaxis response regulator CheB